MGRPLPPRVVKAGPYLPTTTRSGEVGNDGAFRMSNLIVRGRDPRRMYWETYTGQGDLAEPFDLIALTGTLDLTADSVEVVGTGTVFTDELHLGQRVLAIDGGNSVSYPLAIRRITDDTHITVWKAPSATAASLTGYRQPRLYAINEQRGVSLTGNVLQLDKGSFLGVGSGVNKNFKYASFRALSVETRESIYIDPITPLSPSFANSILIMDMTTPVFYGSKKISDGLFIKPGARSKVWIDLDNALLSGEVKRISGKKVDVSKVFIRKN